MKHLSIAVLLLLAVAAKPADELVKNLPDMGTEDFPYGVYSGTIPVTGTSKTLHYIFTESQGDWNTDPLVIWSNGGPGCSSLLGWLTEIGAFIMPSGSNEFSENPHAWNKNANVLYLDHPAGIGYSTCTGKDECTSSDLQDSLDNIEVLKQWFAKFPEFKQHDLWLTGESYAGIYIPNLLYQID